MQFRLMLFSWVIVSTTVFGQVNTTAQHIDNRIIDAFGIEYVERMEIQSPNRLIYLSYFLDNSYFISDLPIGKPYTDISTIEDLNGSLGNVVIDVNDLESFNILLYSFPRSEHSRTFYKIGNTGKMIVFYSGTEFIDSFNLSLE